MELEGRPDVRPLRRCISHLHKWLKLVIECIWEHLILIKGWLKSNPSSRFIISDTPVRQVGDVSWRTMSTKVLHATQSLLVKAYLPGLIHIGRMDVICVVEAIRLFTNLNAFDASGRQKEKRIDYL